MSIVMLHPVRCTRCGRQWETETVPTYCPFCEGNCSKGEHDKEYSNKVLMSYPPQYSWVCRKCGTQGTDQSKPDQPQSPRKI